MGRIPFIMNQATGIKTLYMMSLRGLVKNWPRAAFGQTLDMPSLAAKIPRQLLGDRSQLIIWRSTVHIL